MNQVLLQLAYRHLKKNKKYDVFIFVFTVVMTCFVQSLTIIEKSNAEVMKKYDHEYYGEWYRSYYIDDPIAFEKTCYQYNHQMKDFRYAFLYILGDYDQQIVAYGSEDFYALCQIHQTVGHLPTKSDEVVLDVDYARKKGYSLYQTIPLQFNGEIQDFHIVGFVKNVYDDFPNIYTGYQNHYIACKVYSDRTLAYGEGNFELYSLTLMTLDQVNPHGYDYNYLAMIVQQSHSSIIFIVQTLVLSTIVYTVLSSLMMKKRSQEFALLRGIGMTTKQLFLMVFYEMIMICLVAATVGAVCTFGVSYLIMLWIESQKGYFVWQISLQHYCLDLFLVLGCAFLSQMYPIYCSSRQALSGAFETRTFQYIQVRYRQLKYQNKMRLAYRELKVNKLIHLFFIIILCVLSSFSIFSFIPKLQNEDLIENGWYVHEFDTQHYATVEIPSQSQIPEVSRSRLFRYQGSISCSYNHQELLLDDYCVMMEDFSTIDEDILQGHYPQNDHEVIINKDPYLYMTQSENDITIVKDLEIGDQLTIQGQDVEIVGKILPHYEGIHELKFYDFPIRGIYMTANMYQQIVMKEDDILLQMFYNNSQEKNIIYTSLMNTSQDILNTWKTYGKISYSIGNEERLFEINPIILCFFGILGICLCYFINKNEIINMSQDYTLYKLIGMTERDLRCKQICKGVIIWGIVMMLNLLIILLGTHYYAIKEMLIKEYICSGIVLWGVCLGLYVIPLQMQNYQIKRSE